MEMFCACKARYWAPEVSEAVVKWWRSQHTGDGHAPIDSFAYDLAVRRFVTSSGAPKIRQSYDWREKL